jgi:hypothetical protein
MSPHNVLSTAASRQSHRRTYRSACVEVGGSWRLITKRSSLGNEKSDNEHDALRQVAADSGHRPCACSGFVSSGMYAHLPRNIERSHITPDDHFRSLEFWKCTRGERFILTTEYPRPGLVGHSRRRSCLFAYLSSVRFRILVDSIDHAILNTG